MTNFDDAKERAIRLLHEGLNDTQVADEVGVHRKTVGTWRREAGIPVVNPAPVMPKSVAAVSVDAPVIVTRPNHPCVETNANGSVINQRFPHEQLRSEW